MEKIKMSFYRGTFNKEKLVKFINETDKDIRYTFGLSYRNPTTNKVKITKAEALQIIETESLLDADEYDNALYLNAYHANDLF